ncbi:MAG: zinc ribbon domain-containing protein, partial [Candidatus Omnitrophica bacterium]|nr:zinc ribbon domain-containing protein [Candidatus Omnitrophota bacterium]
MPNDKEVLEGKPFAILSYLWILCLVPLILKKENRFAMFHAKQGLVLFIGE